MPNKSFRQAPTITRLLQDTVFGATQDESAAHDGSGLIDVGVKTTDIVSSIADSWLSEPPIFTGSGKRRAAGQLGIDDVDNTPLADFGWYGASIKFPVGAVSLDSVEFLRRGNAGDPARSIIFAFYDPIAHTILDLAGQTKFTTVPFAAGTTGPIISLNANGLLVPPSREMYMLMKGANITFDTAASMTLAAAIPYDLAGMRADNVTGTSGHVFAIPNSSATPPLDLSGSVAGSGANYNFEAALLFTYNT